MRNGLVWAGGSCALMVFTSPAWGQPPSSGPAVLWYRSGEGCPDWADFSARLGDRRPLVRPAEVGDRVDFVVNIAMTPNGARGRLERQTESGTVAIREVEGAHCERVADVVALNLALALDPERDALPAQNEPAAPIPKGGPVVTNSGAAGPATQPNNAPAGPPLAGAAKLDSSSGQAEPAQRAGFESARWQVGVQGGVLSAFNPGLLVRGSAFVEHDTGLVPLPRLTLRVAFVAALGSTDTTSGDVRQTILAGRVELCPLRFGGPRLLLRPCAAAELGQLQASRAYDDSSLWTALGAHLRGGWLAARPVALEAELGILVPLARYEVSAGSSVLYRSAALGVAAGLGGSITF